MLMEGLYLGLQSFEGRVGDPPRRPFSGDQAPFKAACGAVLELSPLAQREPSRGGETFLGLPGRQALPQQSNRWGDPVLQAQRSPAVISRV